MEKLGLLATTRPEAQLIDRPLGPMRDLQVYDEGAKTYVTDPHKRRFVVVERFVPEIRLEELSWADKLERAKLVVAWEQVGERIVARPLKEYLSVPGFYAQRLFDRPAWIWPFYSSDKLVLSAEQLGAPPRWAWSDGMGKWLNLAEDEWKRLAA